MLRINLRRNSRLVTVILVISLLLLFCAQSKVLILKDPLILIDEAMYAEIAKNLLKEGKLGLDFWDNAYHAVGQQFYVYPPVAFYLLASWFKIFGFSILNQRLLTLFISIGFYLVFFFYAKSFFRGKYTHLPALIVLILLNIDPFFSQATRFGRLEIMVTFFGTIALFTFKKSYTEKIDPKLKPLWIICSGFFASLALLTHYIGIIFALSIITSCLIYEGINPLKAKSTRLFLGAFLMLPAIWAVSLLPNIASAKLQFLQATNGFVLYPGFLVLFWQNLYFKLIISCCILLSLAIFFYLTKSKNKTIIPLFSLMTFGWFINSLSYREWYFVYALPSLYLATIIILTRSFEASFRDSSKLLKDFIRITLSILVVTGIAYKIILISLNFGSDYNYDQFTEKILERIPEEKTVFLSSIPDPYYAIKERQRNIKIYEWPVVRIDTQDLLSLLDNSDYIVFSGVYNGSSTIIQSYLKINSDQITEIGSENQYQALVVKLKPREQRLHQ